MNDILDIRNGINNKYITAGIELIRKKEGKEATVVFDKPQ